MVNTNIPKLKTHGFRRILTRKYKVIESTRRRDTSLETISGKVIINSILLKDMIGKEIIVKIYGGKGDVK